jgi:hypothetical protein
VIHVETSPFEPIFSHPLSETSLAAWEVLKVCPGNQQNPGDSIYRDLQVVIYQVVITIDSVALLTALVMVKYSINLC